MVEDCGCDERRAKLNAMFPGRNVEMDAHDVTAFEELLPAIERGQIEPEHSPAPCTIFSTGPSTLGRSRATAQERTSGWSRNYNERMSIHVKFKTYSAYPDAVSNNAKRGIELNEKVGNKCATQVGKVRAQQLAKGESVSFDTVRRMYSYLSRAEEYYDESDSQACGTISYLLWGGKAGLRWAEKIMREEGKL